MCLLSITPRRPVKSQELNRCRKIKYRSLHTKGVVRGREGFWG